MTCGSSEPLATAGDRCCPCGTVAARTQRGPSPKIHRLCLLHHGVALRALRRGLEVCGAEGALSTMGTVDVSSGR
jgi:hypothetical protein